MEEHFKDKVILVNSKEKDFETKIDCLEWLSRYAVFFSKLNINKMIEVCKELLFL